MAWAGYCTAAFQTGCSLLLHVVLDFEAVSARSSLLTPAVNIRMFEVKGRTGSTSYFVQPIPRTPCATLSFFLRRLSQRRGCGSARGTASPALYGRRSSHCSSIRCLRWSADATDLAGLTNKKCGETQQIANSSKIRPWINRLPQVINRRPQAIKLAQPTKMQGGGTRNPPHGFLSPSSCLLK